MGNLSCWQGVSSSLCSSISKLRRAMVFKSPGRDGSCTSEHFCTPLQRNSHPSLATGAQTPVPKRGTAPGTTRPEDLRPRSANAILWHTILWWLDQRGSRFHKLRTPSKSLYVRIQVTIAIPHSKGAENNVEPYRRARSSGVFESLNAQ